MYGWLKAVAVTNFVMYLVNSNMNCANYYNFLPKFRLNFKAKMFHIANKIIDNKLFRDSGRSIIGGGLHSYIRVLHN